jgi:TolA-binding protein
VKKRSVINGMTTVPSSVSLSTLISKLTLMGLALWILPGSMAFGAVPRASNQPAPQSSISKFPEGERLVYTRLVEAYRRNQLSEVTRQRQILERNYPTSVHLDNAYYLTGMVEFQNNRLGEALKSFDIVKERYAKSNKRPSALFAMAMTYQRLKLAPQAHRVFERIIKEYPGSPESQRAWMQLRLEKEAPAKR